MTETTITKAPADMTPVEVDTELARIWDKQYQVRGRIASLKKDLARKHTYGTRRGQLVCTGTNRVEKEDQVTRYEAQLEVLNDEARPFNREYASRPWARYYLVTNVNGHVHRDMTCNTCFPTTEYQWRVELADCDEEVMVEDFGEKACTVCFPNAPTRPAFAGPGRLDREAKQAKAAEKAAKQAAKAAKGITSPDGSPLKGANGWGVINTEVTARQAAVSAVLEIERAKLHIYQWTHSEHQNEQTQVRVKSYEYDQAKYEATLSDIVAAIAFKHGVADVEVMDDLKPAIDRKLKQWKKEGSW